MLYRCPTCLRTERHSDGAVDVLDAGGQRRPDGPEGLAAWRIVRASLTGGPPIAGPCSACGMPMVAESGTSAPWTIELADGAVQIADGVVRQGERTLTVDEADALVSRAFAASQSVGLTLFQGAMVSWLVVPFLIWIGAMICFGAFLCIGVPQGAEFMPR